MFQKIQHVFVTVDMHGSDESLLAMSARAHTQAHLSLFAQRSHLERNGQKQITASITAALFFGEVYR